MTSLMTLPRELRDQICGYVVQSQQHKPPALDQTFEELTQGRKIFKTPNSSGTGGDTVLGLPEGAVANTASLLRVNRQLHAETLENVKLLPACIYELDVIILDEIILLPTWIQVPHFTTSLDQVHATFRISGRYDASNGEYGNEDDGTPPGVYTQFNRYRGFQIGNGIGPAISWQIYSILDRFSA
jgi:hypothetical protein